MPIYKGGVKVYSISKGGVPVNEVYKGAVKIFPEAVPTNTITSTPPAGYAGLVVTFTSTAVGQGTLVYSWQELLPGGAWQGIAGSPNSPTYARTCPAGDNGTQIRCRIRDQYGQLGPASNVITIAIYAALGGAIAPTAAAGVEGTVVNFTANPTGGSGAYTYQWYLSSPNTVIAGATAKTYAKTLVLAESGRGVFCQWASAGSAVNSNVALMTVTPAITYLVSNIDGTLPTSAATWQNDYRTTMGIAGAVATYSTTIAPNTQVNPILGIGDVVTSSMGIGKTIRVYGANTQGLRATSVVTFTFTSYTDATYTALRPIFSGGFQFAPQGVIDLAQILDQTSPPIDQPGPYFIRLNVTGTAFYTTSHFISVQ